MPSLQLFSSQLVSFWLPFSLTPPFGCVLQLISNYFYNTLIEKEKLDSVINDFPNSIKDNLPDMTPFAITIFNSSFNSPKNRDFIDNYLIIQKIEKFFDEMQQERNNNAQFNGASDEGEESFPEIDLEEKIVEHQISDDLLKNIRFSEIFSRQNSKVMNGLFDPFEIIGDIVKEDGISEVSEDAITGYSGKSNWDYIYQIGQIYGIIRTDRYMI